MNYLERVWRSLSTRQLATLTHVQGRGQVPDWGARPHRVLFLRHDRIGDMIVSTGLLRAISSAFPTLSLDVLASPANAPIIRGESYINAVHVLDKRRPWSYPALAGRLRRARYDAVIDCMVTAPSRTAMLLMSASGARHRIGVSGRGVDDVLSLPVATPPGARHVVDRLAALATPFGIDPERTDFRPQLTLRPEERSAAEQIWRSAGASEGTRHFLVNISAGWDRQWPEDRFITVLRELRQRHPKLRALVIASPAEMERARSIASQGNAQVAPTAGIRQVIALVATSDLVFTPDTSIAHAAAAFRKPAAVMYAPGVGEWWYPYGSPHRTLDAPERTLDSLPVKRVLAALEELIPPDEAHIPGSNLVHDR